MINKKTIKIPIIYNFARSGGTLINRCLGSIEGNIVLSEINPHSSVNPIENQAKDWFGLINAEEFDSFSALGYSNKILYLWEQANKLGKKLIIRDWTVINFADNVTSLYFVNPTKLLEQELYLKAIGIDIIPIAIVRRSFDVFDSMKRTFDNLDSLSIKEFGKYYLSYAQAISSYPIFHYERFCKEPESELKNICRVLDINYDIDFAYNFSQYKYCTGDIDFGNRSRGGNLNKITVLKSIKESDNCLLAMVDDNCAMADKLLGYEDMETDKKKVFWQLIDSRDLSLDIANKHRYEIESQLHQTQSQLHQTQSQLHQTQSLHQELLVECQKLTQLLQQSLIEVDAMKSSKFWKIRQVWFKLKRVFGLST